jgi:hypothetical protein
VIHTIAEDEEEGIDEIEELPLGDDENNLPLPTEANDANDIRHEPIKIHLDQEEEPF